ncbi:hypothetical protein CCACVL1_09557 [Corchorus capsularis]|uniref:DYW domain-containing protein n=1 Tax=Corchorus capsularis TaxID=210143 RepID=A0A1R3IVI4_COCAP|nr:hypothetical protein CCACVL1_09557 [Corchorus capsularis]
MKLLRRLTRAPQGWKSSLDPRIIHAQAVKSPLTQRDYDVLLSLYTKRNLLDSTLRLFNEIPSPSFVSWTSIISAHSDSPLSLTLFISMLRYPTLPNERTFACLFKSCVSLPHCFSFGLSLHALSLKLSLNHNPFSGSALMNFYLKQCIPGSATKVFDEMPEPDEVCYAAMIVGLAQNSLPFESLSLFAKMRSRDISSTVNSLSGVLKAAAKLAVSQQCRIIHGHAVVTGFDKNVGVASSLINGYGKAGVVLDARRLFDENIQVMNDIGWNTLMASYAQQGDSKSVIELFELMESKGFAPDKYSFLAILTSFYHAGLVSEAERWLRRMKAEYGVEPEVEHYTCIVGALGRAGEFESAEMVVMTMPVKPDVAMWRSLLSSCAHYGEADVALSTAKRILELDPNNYSVYAIAANVLSVAGRLDEVAKMEKLMKYHRAKKGSEISWIEVKGKVHVFLAGKSKEEITEGIYTKLAELMEEIEKLGYKPVWNEMLHGKLKRRETFWYHSEKLALAYGILKGAAPQGQPLRIVKNQRVCKDCHEAFKYISRVIEKEIIVKNFISYHKFSNGNCSCGDFW